MALKVPTFVLGQGSHRLNRIHLSSGLPLNSPRYVRVSCKARPRQFRKQQSKQLSLSRPPPDINIQEVADESTTDQSANSDSFSNFQLETDSDAEDDGGPIMSNSIGEGFEDSILSEETGLLTEKAKEGEQLSNIQLEDLINLIRNAEKNIMLLNQARVQALEDLDKILGEKEGLQGQINVLEMRLAETDARIRVAAQEKIRVEVLENQLENLKRELSDRDASEGSEGNIDEKPSKNVNMLNSFSSLSEELSELREENICLKEDIQVLEAKLTKVQETDERVQSLVKERSFLVNCFKEVETKLAAAQEDVSKLSALKHECQVLWEKVESLQPLLAKATRQADQAIFFLQENHELRKKVDRLEESFEEASLYKLSSAQIQQHNELLQQKIRSLEERLQRSDEEIHSHVQLYQESVKEFQDILNSLKEESKRRAREDGPVDDLPWDFWSRILLTLDGWMLEKKISSTDAKSLRDMTWKHDKRIRDAYLACKDKSEREIRSTLLKLISSGTSPGLHIIHIAAEMAPVAKVGGLGDVVCGLSKALQKKGHLVEVVLPKYDCMQYDRIGDFKALEAVIESYFDGQLYKNKIWVGTVEGIPVYFIESHHPSRFFWRGQFYGEHDDFKRFSFFSRAALELLLQAGKKPDIIHCHDWQTAFVAPLYWDLYAPRGLNSARVCFTCHNFEYQGKAPASELRSCGLDVQQLNRPDRMQDNTEHDKVNPIKGAIVFSNIVTTVSPTYAQEVRTPEGGRGLQGTLNYHSRKFVGILNGIDTEAWNPSTDSFIRSQFSADDLQGKVVNKEALRKLLKLSSEVATQPLVGCITRLVPQKGVHLIRHAIFRTLELGGQFILLGSSPVPHIQREFEGIAINFENHPHIRLLLKYDEALSHSIYAASDMFIIPSIFEPCGLTQMIAMRYGSVPIARKTGGLNDSVFDINDDTIPVEFRNGFTFSVPDEQCPRAGI
ncbi:probable starch synthase 4, chloroplastic/amyloplastic isoform X2 [Aristolochia californica]|uniref:probable starch synthase 4, chloroplastic/amyloplastic isoform X2 n=1 Tax=Aristolochia californica TaxID=171875 RepID=UPI0035DBE844